MIDILKAKRIVVKIGSALLVDSKTQKLQQAWLDALVEDIIRLKKLGKEVVIVTSGSVGLGRCHMELFEGTLKLEEKQAAAAVGQLRLARAYSESFARFDRQVAQILLTLNDTETRSRYLNVGNTIETLLKMGIIPIINENDSVTIESIKFGDNDRLSAMIAQIAGADTLVLLSDIDGLYTADPRKDSLAKHLPTVETITEEIEAMAGDAPVGFSTGGMVTKLAAAKIAMSSGCHMVIMNAKAPSPLTRLENGERCTWFIADSEPQAAKKNWIAARQNLPGTVIVDTGAENALLAQKNLLPVGIINIDGSFGKGEVVSIQNADREEIGKGIVAYTSDEIKKIMGKQTDEIEKIIGYVAGKGVIHENDMVVF
ncbi:MAG: glutamate 5-kinase [Alphaproteobacteria bacterium]